ncbi:UNVERIFIED_CONTAM: hypothetical protein PYX00_010533 [Menopon gallinae]|uniref:Ribosomal protein L34 n=1 Tax=Menopon gallinae TaxID=328185 RepID=A0AAW2HFR7_9NEOP
MTSQERSGRTLSRDAKRNVIYMSVRSSVSGSAPAETELANCRRGGKSRKGKRRTTISTRGRRNVRRGSRRDTKKVRYCLICY